MFLLNLVNCLRKKYVYLYGSGRYSMKSLIKVIKYIL